MEILKLQHVKNISVVSIAFVVCFMSMMLPQSPAWGQNAEISNKIQDLTDIAVLESGLQVDAQSDFEIEKKTTGIHVQIGRNGPLPEPGNSLSMEVLFAQEIIAQDGDSFLLGSKNGSVEAMVQPISNGARVVTQLLGPESPNRFSYRLQIPRDSQLLEVDGGYYIESGSEVYGFLHDPWAIDARGVRLQTKYELNNGVLTQEVDTTSREVAYPVTADPAWTYTYSYNMYKTAAQTKSLLYSCFNCYFPVAGAPAEFPVPGQILPLSPFGMNFECKFQSSQTATNYFSFRFVATKNHVDGLGSAIRFDFVLVGGVKKLVVNASIENQLLNNNVYKSQAATTWGTFASNLNHG